MTDPHTSYALRAWPVVELPVPGWECFFGRHDLDFHKLIFYVWVVQGGGKTILIDAGPPPDEENFQALVLACQTVDPKSLMVRLRSFDQVLSQAGLAPESIDYLLITQPITYHTGGLLPEYFPRATVYLSKAGLMEFLLDRPGHPPHDAYFTEGNWQFLRQLLIEDRLRLVDGPTEVVDGVRFETTGGHHPGSAAVKVKTSRGVVGILETAFLKENVDQEQPIGVAENAALCRQVIRRYKRECDLVLAIHDNTLLERFPEGIVA